MHVARTTVPPLRAHLPPCRGLKRELLFGCALVFLDSLAFACAYLGFLHLRMIYSDGPALSGGGPLALCLGAIFIVFFATNRYTLRTDMDSVRFAAELGLACLIAFAVALFLQFAVFLFDLSRSRMVLLASFLLFAPMALVFRRILGRAFRVRAETQTFLILGAGPEAVHFYRACRDSETAQTLRFVDLSGERAGERLNGPGTPIVAGGWWDDFLSLLDGSIEAIVLAEPFPNLSSASAESLVRAHFYHAPILTLEAFYEKYWRKIPVVTDPLWALRQDFRLARDSSYRFFKRVMDIGVAAVGLLITLPLFLACAVAVRMEDGEPIFYSQCRISRDRQRFTLYKFRTMRPRVEADDDDASLDVHDDEERITRVGSWLRKLRLDELPQLWNVLKGDMSLIGPRAEWDRCVEIYEQNIPCYHFRHLVKPGITGWAQVNHPYGRSIENTLEKLKYDLFYIKNYSLLLDASIVLKTLYVVLSFKGK